MGKKLSEIAQQLSTPKTVQKTVPEKMKVIEEVKPVPKVQLIYAFNGTGKTRLSLEFKQLVAPKADADEGGDKPGRPRLSRNKILYYSAFTEDLFYWDNDLEGDAEYKLKIHANSFTDWVLKDQGQDRNIIENFQRYTNTKLTPRFNEARTERDKSGAEVLVKEFSEVTFSMARGHEENSESLKISKGEESCFTWSVFFSLLEQVIETLDSVQPDYPEATPFDGLEYVFIDDPVSSLDDNHLIELAVDLARLVKSSRSGIKFIITTHNSLFYNVLHNELKAERYKKYLLKKYEYDSYELVPQSNDSPFSYHLHLKAEIEKAVKEGQLQKYHYNFMRNILEKISTFLGYDAWGDLLPQTGDGKPNGYLTRVVNISSHSKHAGEEVADLTEDDKRVLGRLLDEISATYRFKPSATQTNDSA